MTNEQLAELAHELRTQDNACTAHPFFVVFNRKRQYGMDSEYCNNYDWIEQESGDYIVADERKVAAIERYERMYLQDPPKWEKNYYVEVDEFVTCTFTRKAAEAFIRRRGHDYDNLIIYVDSFVRNPEMMEIREMLLQEPAKENLPT